MRNVRLEDVAKKAGVSRSTAAAAIRGESIVKAATREKVETAARELGYVRNSAASVLASHNTRNPHKQAFMVWLSAFSPEEQRFTWTETAEVAAEAAVQLGLQFDHYNIDHPEDTPRIMREIEARGCDGVIWEYCTYQNLPPISWKNFSVVSTQEDRRNEGFDIVRANQFRGDLRLLRRVYEAGYRRIGICLREHRPLLFDDESRRGAALNFWTHDLSAEERIPILRISRSEPDAEKKLIQWAEKNRPEIVVGFGNMELYMLQRNGFRIPEDLAFAALHVDKPSKGELAGLTNNKELIPAHAVRVLMQKMSHGIRGLSRYPQETVLVMPIMEGASCPGLQGDPVDWLTLSSQVTGDIV